MLTNIGVGWGLQIGADITEVVIVLNSDDAVKAFSRGGNVTVGGMLFCLRALVGLYLLTFHSPLSWPLSLPCHLLT
jgi:lipid-binding SYLF domain-containing protein